MTIKKGDVVTLKSGGTKKTVEAIDTEDGTIHCVWEDNDGETQRGEYDPDTLKTVS